MPADAKGKGRMSTIVSGLMDNSPLLDHSFGIEPLPAYASPGPAPGTALFTAASGGGDQTEQECTISTTGSYGWREAQCGICAHLWQACDYGWRKWGCFEKGMAVIVYC